MAETVPDRLLRKPCPPPLPDPVDFAGRLAFLLAAERVWKPSLLSTLSRARPAVLGWLETQPYFRAPFDLPPVFHALLVLMNLTFPLEPSQDRCTIAGKPLEGPGLYWASILADPSPAAATAARALEQWRGQYPINAADTWILNVAIATLVRSAWCGQPLDEPLKWLVPVPSELRQPFTFTVPWVLINQAREKRSLTALQAKTVKDFRHALADYCARVRVHRADRKGNLDSVAEFAARYLNGEPFSKIGKGLLLAPGSKADPSERARRSVERFAHDIGLTLPGQRTMGETVGTAQKKPAQSGINRSKIARRPSISPTAT